MALSCFSSLVLTDEICLIPSVHEPRFLVIDKCFVQASTAADVRRLQASWSLIAPTSFFLEVLTDSSPTQRARIVGKFIPGENPAAEVFIPQLLRSEIEQHLPAWPDHVQFRREFTFNPELSVDHFRFLQEDSERLLAWENQNERRVQDLCEMALDVTTWFPQVAVDSPMEREQAVRREMQRIAEDPEVVVTIYRSFRKDGPPPADLLNQTWAVYRNLQVHLLQTLELVRRYGFRAKPQATKRLHNDALDLDYILLAVLAGAFASKDQNARTWFRLLRPDGMLIPS